MSKLSDLTEAFALHLIEEDVDDLGAAIRLAIDFCNVSVEEHLDILQEAGRLSWPFYRFQEILGEIGRRTCTSPSPADVLHGAVIDSMLFDIFGYGDSSDRPTDPRSYLASIGKPVIEPAEDDVA